MEDRTRWRTALEDKLTTGWVPVGLVLLGIGARLAWLSHQSGKKLDLGEAMNVARAIQQRGQFADAFQAGQGPTAHLMPLSPLIAGLTYRLYGFDTFTSNALLTTWSLAAVFVGFWLQMMAFEALGLMASVRVAAFAILCIVPFNFWLETVAFRVWEGGLAVALASLLLYMSVRWDGSNPGWAKLTAVSIVLSMLCFVAPSMAIAGIAVAAIFAWRNLMPQRILAFVALFCVTSSVIFLPWVMRNDTVFGQPILFRTDAGLELAVAFREDALNTKDAARDFSTTMKSIHPRVTLEAFDAMKRGGGEIKYSETLGAAALHWMANNPFGTLRLITRHIAGMLFPPAWYWTMWSDNSRATDLKVYIHWVISGLGLGGIFLACFARDRRLQYPIAMTALTIIPYAFVQPTLRYRYLIFGLLVYFSAYLIAESYRRLASKPVREDGFDR
jgi:hypothetical protein